MLGHMRHRRRRGARPGPADRRRPDDNNGQDAGIDIAAATKDGEVEGNALAQLGNNWISGMENYLVKAGRLAGVSIAAPGANQKANAWLDANTDRIGQALVKLQGQGVTGFKQTDLEQEVFAPSTGTRSRTSA
jgi:hypothetical protein